MIDPVRDAIAIEAEYWTTDHWAIEGILRCEILTPNVIDPCCGDGRMARILAAAGYKVWQSDKYDWAPVTGDKNIIATRTDVDWLTFDDPSLRDRVAGQTVVMNPPFSLACKFVDRAFTLGARKVVCFQRMAWTESQDRRGWWAARPPQRRYDCGPRVKSDLGTIPVEMLKGKSREQPAAWFVWERGHPAGTLHATIWKD